MNALLFFIAVIEWLFDKAARRFRIGCWMLGVGCSMFVPSCSPLLADTQVPLQFFLSPDEDAQSALLAFVGEAKQSILIADYSFVDPPLTDLLIAKSKSGVEVKCVFDKIQASGAAMKTELAKLQAAGIPFITGTSDKSHIMHHKFCVIDDAAVLFGSFNFTLTAQKESNALCIDRNPIDAQRFTAEWVKINAFMLGRAKSDEASRAQAPR